jgi:hypothetical protein
MRSYEFLTNMCFGPFVCRKVSVDYTVGQYDDVELMSVWTMRDLEPMEPIGEELTDYLTEEGYEYFQQLSEQDWKDRKQDEWEHDQEREAFLND